MVCGQLINKLFYVLDVIFRDSVRPKALNAEDRDIYV